MGTRTIWNRGLVVEKLRATKEVILFSGAGVKRNGGKEVAEKIGARTLWSRARARTKHFLMPATWALVSLIKKCWRFQASRTYIILDVGTPIGLSEPDSEWRALSRQTESAGLCSASRKLLEPIYRI